MLQIDDIDSDWVFAYGSLIWSPGIDYAEKRVAKLHGYHRSFCINSTRYRGTFASPGAVLGLDKGGSCIGVAYRFTKERRKEALVELFKREIPEPERAVYRAAMVQVALGPACEKGIGHPSDCAAKAALVTQEQAKVSALTFLADRSLPSYIRLDINGLVARLAKCIGERGRNYDYAINTWKSLREMGFEDRRLNQVVSKLLAQEPA